MCNPIVSRIMLERVQPGIYAKAVAEQQQTNTTNKPIDLSNRERTQESNNSNTSTANKNNNTKDYYLEDIEKPNQKVTNTISYEA